MKAIISMKIHFAHATLFPVRQFNSTRRSKLSNASQFLVRKNSARYFPWASQGGMKKILPGPSSPMTSLSIHVRLVSLLLTNSLYQKGLNLVTRLHHCEKYTVNGLHLQANVDSAVLKNIGIVIWGQYTQERKKERKKRKKERKTLGKI